MLKSKDCGFVTFELTNDVLTVIVRQSHPSEAEWHDTKATMIAYYDQAEKQQTRFAIVFNLTDLGMLHMQLFQDWASLFLKERERTAIVLICTSVITSNPILRQGMNFFFTHMYSSIRPLSFARNMTEALKFIDQQRGI